MEQYLERLYTYMSHHATETDALDNTQNKLYSLILISRYGSKPGTQTAMWHLQIEISIL